MSEPWVYTTPGFKPANVAWDDRYLSFRDAPVVLVCGGPSLLMEHLHILNSTRIAVAAVNNAPAALWQHGRVKPSLWFCADRPGHFHLSLWRDPSIAKFVWRDFVYGRFDKKNAPRIWRKGQWVNGGVPTTAYPNVWAYHRHEKFIPEDYLTASAPTWGTQNSTDPTGHGTRSVMLIAIWSLYRMGFRTIYLLGCDFDMETEEAAYAFDQKKLERAEQQRMFRRMATDWFPALLPHFNTAGLRVINCSCRTKLDCFPKMPLTQAIDSSGYVQPYEPTARLYERF